MLTKDQQNVFDIIDTFCGNSIKIGGLAGTGKTFLIGHARKNQAWLNRTRIAFCTFTGKASIVLREKLEAQNALYDTDYIGTIHGLIYIPITEYDSEKKRVILKGFERKSPQWFEYDLIIIDEGSMVSERVWNDLMSFNRPIIVFGDHGQLEPVNDSFSLLKNPDYTMTEICRQAKGSPIIKLAHFVRQSGYIPLNRKFDNDGRIIKASWNDENCRKFFKEKCLTGNTDTIILCGFNTSRTALNKAVRMKKELKHKIPYPNERVICLKNNRKSEVMNGQIGTVVWWQPTNEKEFSKLTIEFDNTPYPIEVMCWDGAFGKQNSNDINNLRNSHQFKMAEDYAFDNGFFGIDFFDYGYAITVHKSQGSEWNNVILFEQLYPKLWDSRRFLYTAITRAKKQLFMISDFYGGGGL